MSRTHQKPNEAHRLEFSFNVAAKDGQWEVSGIVEGEEISLQPQRCLNLVRAFAVCEDFAAQIAAVKKVPQ